MVVRSPQNKSIRIGLPVYVLIISFAISLARSNLDPFTSSTSMLLDPSIMIEILPRGAV